MTESSTRQVPVASAARGHADAVDQLADYLAADRQADAAAIAEVASLLARHKQTYRELTAALSEAGLTASNRSDS